MAKYHQRSGHQKYILFLFLNLKKYKEDITSWTQRTVSPYFIVPSSFLANFSVSRLKLSCSNFYFKEHKLSASIQDSFVSLTLKKLLKNVAEFACENIYAIRPSTSSNPLISKVPLPTLTNFQ